MNDLIAWLRQQLDTDERIAQRAAADWPSWAYDRETFTVSSAAHLVAGRKDRDNPINDVDGEHIAAQDPARVLRQVRAHRAILDRYEFARSHPTSLVSSFVRGQDNGFWQGLEEAVKELVSIYSDRDGYNPEWSA